MAEPRPATRVGHYVCFEGGFVRKLTLRERFLLWSRVKRTIKSQPVPRKTTRRASGGVTG